MKSLISAITIIAFLLQSLGSLVVIMAFEMNQDYIAKNLCINKSKPQLHCNGKCHMQKMLQKEEAQNHNPVSAVKEKSEVVQYFESRTIAFVNPYFIRGKVFFNKTENKLSGYRSSVFQPPSLILFS